MVIIDQISIIIKALLSQTSKEQIIKDLKNIEANLKPLDLKMGISDEAQIKLFKSMQKIEQQQAKMNAVQDKAAAKVALDNEKQLQFEQKVRIQIEKNVETEKLRTTELAKQVALYKEQKLNQINSTTIGKSAVLTKFPETKAEMERLISDLDKVGTKGGKSFEEINLQQAKWNTSMKDGSNKLSALRSQADGFGTSLAKNMVKMVEWTIVATAMYAPLRALESGVSFLNDLNKAQTNVAMITGMSREKIQGLTEDYSNLAKQLHETTAQVMQGAEEFLRAGHNQEETAKLLQASTIMSKIAGQDQKSSADQLIAITNGFGKSAAETMDIVDKLTMVDNNSATSTKELGTALERTAASSKLAGTSFENLVSYIATVNFIAA